MAEAIPKVSLKLLVDTKNKRVIFAEAGKDFIDFLFNILSLRLATVVRIVTKPQMAGSISNLYESIENFDQTYIQPNQEKDTLLKPKSQIPINLVPLLPLDSTMTTTTKTVASSASKRFYKCNNSSYNAYSSYVTDNPSASCRSCGGSLGVPMTFVDYLAGKSKSPAVASGGGGEGGFVKGVVSYMVMDDLVVMPLSIVTGITQLSKFNVKEVGVLEERIVEVGMDEGVKLLKEALQ